MEKVEQLEYGAYYHLYNRGIDGCELFRNSDNYRYFMQLFNLHVSPIVDTYAWVLMGNHFHFLVRVKQIEEYDNGILLQDEKSRKMPHQYFSNMFNAYTKAYNKSFDRHGSLFERRFKRKRIESLDYLQQVIVYIHNNPVHHGFTERADDYAWSSFGSYLSNKPTKLLRAEVLQWFDTISNFVYVHERQKNIDLSDWLNEN